MALVKNKDFHLNGEAIAWANLDVTMDGPGFTADGAAAKWDFLAATITGISYSAGYATGTAHAAGGVAALHTVGNYSLSGTMTFTKEAHAAFSELGKPYGGHELGPVINIHIRAMAMADRKGERGVDSAESLHTITELFPNLKFGAIQSSSQNGENSSHITVPFNCTKGGPEEKEDAGRLKITVNPSA